MGSAATAAGRHRSPGRLLPVIRRWQLWQLPRQVLGYVLLVDAVAAGLAVAAGRHLTADGSDLLLAGLLAAGAISHAELARRIEARNRIVGLCVDMSATWIFAAALLVPLWLVVPLIAMIAVHDRRRLRRGSPYRNVFSAAAALLAAAAVAGLPAVWATVGLGGAANLGSLPGVLLAMLVYWLVSDLIVFTAARSAASGRLRWPARAVAWSDLQLEVATLTQGLLLAAAMAIRPWLVVLGPPALLVLHRHVLLGQLEQASRTDAKTGLLNATAWRDAAGQRLSGATGSFAVLICDLDHFKRINDTYGHLAGDRVLVATAEALKAELRAAEAVGRFGGEEFVIALTDLDTAEVLRVADRIRRRIADLRITADGQALPRVSVSIGVADAAGRIPDLDRLLRQADSALYAAKNGGRDRVVHARTLAGAGTGTGSGTGAPAGRLAA